MDTLKVARRIVNRCAAINEPVNIVKLQQILYLVDMFYFVNFEKHLLDSTEKFKAWQNGPTLTSIVLEYPIYGFQRIKTNQETEEIFSKDEKYQMLNFIDKLAKIPLYELVKISCKKNSAWAKTFKKEKFGEIKTELIEEEAKASKFFQTKAKHDS